MDHVVKKHFIAIFRLKKKIATITTIKSSNKTPIIIIVISTRSMLLNLTHLVKIRSNQIR